MIKKILSPFKPEITEFRINYKQKLTKLFYKINIEPGVIRKKIGKIIIPKSPDYRIVGFVDEGFSNLINEINVGMDNTKYIIKTNQLPPCNTFRIELNGRVDQLSLDNIVRVQPARNKNSTTTFDRYWLHVMLRDIDTLEKIYKYLEVSDINVLVKVPTRRYFNTELPKSMIKAIDIFNEYLAAGRTNDKARQFRAWRSYKLSFRIDLEDVTKYFKDLTQKLDLSNFISLDDPFYKGEIGHFDTFQAIPSNFTVEAITNLSFKNPTASGVLEFHKKKFQSTIKDEIEDKWGSEKK